MSLVSGPGRATTDGLPPELQLAFGKHVQYIEGLNNRQDELEYWLTEHLRLNGLYWGLTALHILRKPEVLPREETINFVLSCQCENGGFGAAPGHDAHVLYTVSAVQILATIDALDDLERMTNGGKKRVVEYLARLQDKNTGTFAGDEWGETDTRFLYAALNALSLLDSLALIDIQKATEYLQACANFDGGYGVSPGAESHSGQIFACVAAFAILGRLDLVDHERLGSWLSERQLPNGGLNGRPEKLEDVCYSWWVLSPMSIIKKLDWIDREKQISFILSCQDAKNGGLADRPEDMVDVFHTHFAIAGLSLLGYPGLEAIDPVYCMPVKTIDRIFPR